MTRFVSATHDKSTLTVQYVADNGDILLRSGGTIAWRFNNPGNMRPPSKYVTTSIGVGDSKSGKFFIFPDYDTGRAEKKALLRRKYNNETIASAMEIYAPRSENDTDAYIKWICDHTGFARDRQLSSMNDGELDSMMSAMEKREGYYARVETRHEKWVKTASVTLSNGAQPIPNQPVVVKTNGKQQTLQTNPLGQLPLLPFEQAGQQIQLLMHDTQDGLKEIGTITTQAVSSAHVFFRDLFVSTAATQTHYAKDSTRNDAKTPFRYKIVSGDTLGKIAAKFKTSVDQLKQDNHLKSARIFAGDYLTIHGSKPQEQAAPEHASAAKAKPASSEAGDAMQSGSHGSLSSLGHDASAPKSAPASTAATATASTPASTPKSTPAASAPAPASAAAAPQGASSAVTPDRSKQGQGHPLALIPAVSPQAPWMEKALDQAKLWHGQKEDVITKTINYHKEVGGNLKSLVGNGNPWCASFVNWCLMQAGYPITASPMDSQSFRNSKNFVKIDHPVFGAVAVYKHPKGGHAAFVYAKTKAGGPILLGGNQSDAINFGTQKASELKGFYVPASYLKFAQAELAKGAVLETSTADELNDAFHIEFKKKKDHADR
ncbi:TIGR02594 family protein [Paraburkholderia sp. Tr-20389]|uniref:TIGR02594 family protein n=1 Tax=Paraburkholderia sp. Tr-20389 TaxID=2703903 RepID=UPI00198135E1|nr:TIGR02594 family protein [Paraburkholderia sp. Tr-20389]MBN3757849.1 TIGR02594 family protein [Paraburkholderia sp. Tr-20389]